MDMFAMAAPAATAQIAEDIRGLRGPVEIPEPFPWLAAGAAALAALLVLIALRRVLRRGRGHTAEATPRDAALAALAAAAQWRDAGRPREFAYAVSDAVRVYLQRRFDLAATRLTTDEFVAELRRNPPAELAAHDEELEAFLEGADVAKFGAGALRPRHMAAMLAAARRLIDVTSDGEPVRESVRIEEAAA